jgi:hypothetical protein
MSKRVNWNRLRVREKIGRSGSESVSAPLPFLLPSKPRRRAPSKAELRSEAERALREWKGRQP